MVKQVDVFKVLACVVLLAACDDGAASEAQDAGADAASDANVAAPVTLLGATQVVGLGAGELTALAAFGDHALVGTAHGVYLGRAPEFALEQCGATSLGERRVSALTSFQDALFAVTADDDRGAATVWRSDDACASWTNITEGVLIFEGAQQAQFTSNGARLILSVAGRLFEWDADDQSWSFLPPAFTLEDGAPEPNAAFDRIAFDGSRLFIDALAADPYSAAVAGVYTSEVHATPWRRVDTLGVWGYYAFAFDGARGFTSNDTQLFARSGDVWSVVLEKPLEGRIANDLLIHDGVVLAAGQGMLRRSVDMSTWQDMMEAPTTSDEALASAGTRVLWIADKLRSSDNYGADWTDHDNELAVVDRVLTASGVTYANVNDQLYVARGDDAFAPFASTYAARSVSVRDGVLWICSSWTGCARYDAQTPQGVFINAPVDVRGTPAIWANSRGVFLADQSAGACDSNTPGRGLYRLNETDQTWQAINEGLPQQECSGELGVQDALAIYEAEDRLFAAFTDSTYVSTDDGAHWSQAHGVSRALDVAACGGRIVVRTDSGLFTSADHGRTFTPLTQSIARATSLVAAGSTCVVGSARVDGQPTVLTSNDATTFTPHVAFTTPVLALDFDGRSIVVGTRGRGVMRISTEAR